VRSGDEPTDEPVASHRVLGRSRRLPIIARTANAAADDRERCLASGMDDDLPKPVRIEDLRDLLDRHVSTCGARLKALPEARR
jgi:CheY-like chemotaxis protein